MSVAAAPPPAPCVFSCANAGSGALRVVPVAAPVLVPGALAVVVGVAAACVPDFACVSAGAPWTVPVLVEEPQPTSSVAAHAATTGPNALLTPLVIARMVFAGPRLAPRLAARSRPM